MYATAKVGEEISSCCKAHVSHGDAGLYCKKCYGHVEWEV